NKSFTQKFDIHRKTYYSENAYANHLRSNKHKVAELKAAQEVNNIDDEWEDIEEDISNENHVNFSKGGLLDEDDIELILPSGARIGHRSMRRYYKQNLRPEEHRDSIIINRLITQYGDYHRRSGGVLIAKGGHAKHAQYYITTLQDKRHHDFDTRIGIKANKLQRHFRAQIL
ncbi:2141_t:CDS:2, partial [Racocetra persica]